jgi:two-component system response regulator HydG
MPLSLQAKLLGVLESRKVTPLGSTRQVDIDIIVVAATNRDLEAMVEQGTFRRDLYYRLSGITLELPPLRARKEDIPLLLEYFMVRRGLLKPGQKPSPELVQQFVGHQWPGNIRELDNVVNRLSIMSQSVAEGQWHEVARSILAPDQAVEGSAGLFERVEQFERQLITEALLAAGGNKSEAARILGIHEATVRTKLKRYGISAEGGLPN